MKYLSTLIIAILVASCGILWEYRGLHDFDDMTWKQGDVKSFDFEIQEGGLYNVVLLFRHAHGFPYSTLNLNFEMHSDNYDFDQNLQIPIIGPNKEYLGDGSVDLWDVEYSILEAHDLKSGNYSVAISHLMSKAELKLAMQVGVRVEKAE